MYRARRRLRNRRLTLYVVLSSGEVIAVKLDRCRTNVPWAASRYGEAVGARSVVMWVWREDMKATRARSESPTVGERRLRMLKVTRGRERDEAKSDAEEGRAWVIIVRGRQLVLAAAGRARDEGTMIRVCVSSLAE